MQAWFECLELQPFCLNGLLYLDERLQFSMEMEKSDVLGTVLSGWTTQQGRPEGANHGILAISEWIPEIVY